MAKNYKTGFIIGAFEIEPDEDGEGYFLKEREDGTMIYIADKKELVELAALIERAFEEE